MGVQGQCDHIDGFVDMQPRRIRTTVSFAGRKVAGEAFRDKCLKHLEDLGGCYSTPHGIRQWSCHDKWDGRGSGAVPYPCRAGGRLSRRAIEQFSPRSRLWIVSYLRPISAEVRTMWCGETPEADTVQPYGVSFTSGCYGTGNIFRLETKLRKLLLE